MVNSTKRARTTVVLVDLAAAHPNTSQAPSTWRPLCTEYAQQISTAVERLFAHTVCPTCAHRWSVHFIDSSTSPDTSLTKHINANIPTRSTNLANIQQFRRDLQSRLQSLPFGENRMFGYAGAGIAKGIQDLLDGVPLTNWSEDESVDSLLGINGTSAMAIDRCSNDHDFLPRLYIFSRVPTCEKDLQNFLRSPIDIQQTSDPCSEKLRPTMKRLNNLQDFLHSTRRAKRHGIRMTWVDSMSRRCEGRSTIDTSLHTSFQNWLIDIGWSGFTSLHSLISDRRILPIRTLIRSLDQAAIPTNSPIKRRNNNLNSLPIETKTVDAVIGGNDIGIFPNTAVYFRAELTMLSSGPEIIDLESVQLSCCEKIFLRLVSFVRAEDVQSVVTESIYKFPDGKLLRPLANGKNESDSREMDTWSSLLSGLLVNLARSGLFAVTELLYVGGDKRIQKTERTLLQPITPMLAKVQTISSTRSDPQSLKSLHVAAKSIPCDSSGKDESYTKLIDDLSTKFFETYLPGCLSSSAFERTAQNGSSPILSFEDFLSVLASASASCTDGYHFEHFSIQSIVGSAQQDSLQNFLFSRATQLRESAFDLQPRETGIKELKMIETQHDEHKESERVCKWCSFKIITDNLAEQDRIGHDASCKLQNVDSGKEDHMEHLASMKNCKTKSRQKIAKDQFCQENKTRSDLAAESLLSLRSEGHVDKEGTKPKKDVPIHQAVTPLYKDITGVVVGSAEISPVAVPSISLKLRVRSPILETERQYSDEQQDVEPPKSTNEVNAAHDKFAELLQNLGNTRVEEHVHESVRECIRQLRELALRLTAENQDWDKIAKIRKRSLKRGKEISSILQLAQKTINETGPTQAKIISGKLWVTILQSYEQIVWHLTQNLRPRDPQCPKTDTEPRTKRYIRRSSTILGCVRVLGELAATRSHDSYFFREIFSYVFRSVISVFVRSGKKVEPATELRVLYDEFEEIFPDFTYEQLALRAPKTNFCDDKFSDQLKYDRTHDPTIHKTLISSGPIESQDEQDMQEYTRTVSKSRTLATSATDFVRKARRKKDAKVHKAMSDGWDPMRRSQFSSQLNAIAQNPLVFIKPGKKRKRCQVEKGERDPLKVKFKLSKIARKLEFPDMSQKEIHGSSAPFPIDVGQAQDFSSSHEDIRLSSIPPASSSEYPTRPGDSTHKPSSDHGAPICSNFHPSENQAAYHSALDHNYSQIELLGTRHSDSNEFEHGRYASTPIEHENAHNAHKKLFSVPATP